MASVLVSSVLLAEYKARHSKQELGLLVCAVGLGYKTGNSKQYCLDFLRVEEAGQAVISTDLFDREKTRVVQRAVEEVLNKVQIHV